MIQKKLVLQEAIKLWLVVRWLSFRGQVLFQSGNNFSTVKAAGDCLLVFLHGATACFIQLLINLWLADV